MSNKSGGERKASELIMIVDSRKNGWDAGDESIDQSARCFMAINTHFSLVYSFISNELRVLCLAYSTFSVNRYTFTNRPVREVTLIQNIETILNTFQKSAVFTDGEPGCCLELILGAGKDWKTPLTKLFTRVYPNKWAFFIAELESVS